MNNQSDWSKSLLNNPRYAKAIAATTQIAQEDYSLVEQELRPVEDALRELKESLESRLSQMEMASISKRGGKTQQDTKSDQLADIYKRLTEEKATDIQQLREILRAKKRTVGHFTLVMMGRTKAGKSTLFATLLGHGYEGIGTGGQRTTRKNKSYDLDNGIRLIDTPGIAAVGGEADEAEALKAVAEADLICYVMTDDSIQVAEFEFLSKLKQQTKPLVILLNVQHNLQDKRRLPRFFKNADEMLTGQDIIDHKERIFRYAREHYQNDSITVIPVMLLAAQLSRLRDDPELFQQLCNDPELRQRLCNDLELLHRLYNDPELCQQLYKASRMQDFLDWISNAVENYGGLLVSQTLLGETGVLLTPRIKTIQQEINTCQESSKLLAQKKRELTSKLRKVGQDGMKRLEIEMQEIFQDLSSRVPNFARNNWDQSSSIQQNAWKQIIDGEVKLKERIENMSALLETEYLQRNQEVLDEISKDFQFSSKSRHQDFHFSGADAGFDFRSILDGVGKILAFAAFIPGVNVLAAVVGGVLMGIFGGFLPSKNERMREACNKIERELKQKIESQRRDYTKNVIQGWGQACTENEGKINQHFLDVEKEINYVFSLLQKSTDSITKARNHLTGFFALRIFYWCKNQNGKVNRSTLISTIIRLTRDPGKFFDIYLKNQTIPSIEAQRKSSHMLDEAISFRTIK